MATILKQRDIIDISRLDKMFDRRLGDRPSYVAEEARRAAEVHGIDGGSAPGDAPAP